MMLQTPPPPSLPPSTSGSDGGRVSSSVRSTRPRRQPMILRESGKSTARIGEIAGSTAAECAAICCCFPCGLVGLIVCAVVKLPAGLCRRAYMKRRRRRISALKKSSLWGPPSVGSSFDDSDLESVGMKEEWGIPTLAPSPEVAAMEKEMWARFYETGFWRSPSQREDLSLERG